MAERVIVEKFDKPKVFLPKGSKHDPVDGTRLKRIKVVITTRDTVTGYPGSFSYPAFKSESGNRYGVYYPDADDEAADDED